MKRIKSILTVLMAAVFALSLVPAGAWADPDPVVSRDDEVATTPANYDTAPGAVTSTIKVPNQTGHTYEIYQVFLGDPKKNDSDPAKTVGLINLRYGTNTSSGHVIGAAVTQADMTKLAQIAFTEADASGTVDKGEIAKMLEFVDLTGIPAGGAVQAGQNSESLPTGYYLVKDVDGSQDGKDDAYTLYLLQVLDNTTITLNAKQDKPTVDKKVADINDSTDAAQGEYGTSADYDIGDAVPFQLTATTAANVHNYTKYHVTLQDTQCDGLNVPAGYKVSVLGEDFYLGADGSFFADDTYGTAYTDPDEDGDDNPATRVTANQTKITVSKGTAKEGCTFAVRVDFESAATPVAGTPNTIDEEAESATVTVAYKSVLNDNAVIGNDGNDNKVYLEFSNNPNSEDDSDEGKTPEKAVAVFTYKVDVDKIDQDYAPLSGAGFTLLKKYLALPAGATATGALSALTDQNNTEDSWFTDGESSATTYWKVVGKHGATDAAVDGQFHWRGIDDGIYKIVETTVPAGYNAADPVDFTVAATHEPDDMDPRAALSATGYEVTSLTTDSNYFQESADGGVFTFTKAGDNNKTHVMGVTTDKEAKVVTAIVNHSGTELPSTGGIGTTIFYVAGTVLVVGAAVMLVAKRRMGAEA